MSSDRWDEIARRLEVEGSGPVGERIGRVATEVLDGTTIGLLLVLGEGREPVEGADVEGEMLDEAQLLLGEGPTIDAIGAESPILVDDLGSAESLARWPGFVARASEAGIAAVFAFPMRVGGVRVGVLTVYRDTSGAMGHAEFADGLVVASLASLLLMDGEHGDGSGSAPLAAEVGSRSRFQIAAGIVAEQLDIPVADALVRIRAHAYATGIRLDDVARGIVDRTLLLEP